MFGLTLRSGRRTAGGRFLVVLVVLLLAAGSWQPAATAAPVPARSADRIAQVPSTMAATSSVALAADPGGFDHAFYRGSDNGVYHRTFTEGSWSASTALGGEIVGAPSATVSGGAVVLAVRGIDNILWLRTNTAGTWGPWQNLGGVLSSAPGLASDTTGRLDVVVRGADGRIWTKTRPAGGSWSGWTSLAGAPTSGPAVVSTGPGNLDVYVAGSDSAVWLKVRRGGQWSGWQSLGGATYVAPAATWEPTAGAVSVLVRGTNDHLYVRRQVAGTWSAWQDLGGTLIDAPAATAVAGSAGGVDVVVRGDDNALWSRRQRGGTWSGWARAWVPAPPPAPAPGLLGTDWTRIPTSQPVVALTFDAGANANALPSILTTLRSKNVPATFFLTGEFVRDFPAAANQVAVGGFPIGNHSDTHPDLRTLSDDQARAEVLTAQASILRACGAETRPLWRFPFGGVDSRVLGLVNSMGYVAVRWTVDTLGWQGTSGGRSAQSVLDRVLAGLQPGEIVLMHVGSHPTDGSTLDADALPRIVDEIRARGYSFVTLDALIGR